MVKFEWTEKLLKIPYAEARRYARPGTDEYDELVSAGNEGMSLAASRFDPSKGFMPSTYLFSYVRGYVMRAAGRGRKKNPRMAFWKSLLSLDACPYKGDDNPETFMRYLGREDRPEGETREELDKLLSRLSRRTRKAMLLYYGQKMSLSAVGLELGLSKQQAQRLLLRGMKAAREAAEVPS